MKKHRHSRRPGVSKDHGTRTTAILSKRKTILCSRISQDYSPKNKNSDAIAFSIVFVGYGLIYTSTPGGMSNSFPWLLFTDNNKNPILPNGIFQRPLN
jgi:hypothetical protein